MRNLTRKRQGQASAEYAILIGLVIAAVVGMQIYVKRGLQAKYKGVGDALNFDSSDPGEAVLQYEPYYNPDGGYKTSFDSSQTETMVGQGKIARDIAKDETSRTGKATQKADVDLDDTWVAAKQ